MMRISFKSFADAATAAVFVIVPQMVSAQAVAVGWETPSGDAGAMRWSPLETVNRSNVGRLKIAWTWKTGERGVPETATQKAARPGNFQTSPVVIGDTMYLSTPYAAVVALDARTGKEFWRYDAETWRAGQPSNGTGFVHRGVATWSDGAERRVFINSRWKLVALNARTGKRIPGFGDAGEVDLIKGLRRPVNKVALHQHFAAGSVRKRDHRGKWRG